MKVKRQCTIEDITHDDLVNLFSTSLYGSSNFYGDYDDEFYRKIDDSKKQGECFEDKMADCLLNGGVVFVYDKNEEGEEDPEKYGILGEVVKNGFDDNYVVYTLSLGDIRMGLEKCFSGDVSKDYDEYIIKCANDFASEESFDFDLVEADCLLQCILFDDLIYG